MADALVIGVDAGGTQTRAVLADQSGRTLGYGVSGPANCISGAPDPAVSLEVALRHAIGDRNPATVAAGCFGIAGASTTHTPWADDAARRAWMAVGLPGVATVTDDATVAFAAGTVHPHGAVLVAGTGAIAAAIQDHRMVRRADGHGWLLGDAGSAVWLGLHALRAALAGLDGRSQPTALTEMIRQQLAPATPLTGLSAALLDAIDPHNPSELGQVAPLVSAAARAGDPVATTLVTRAVEHLMATLAAVTYPHPPAIVLAGGLLVNRGPVAERVAAAVQKRYGLVPATALFGAAGAAALALTGLGTGHDPAAHARLLTSHGHETQSCQRVGDAPDAVAAAAQGPGGTPVVTVQREPRR